MGNFAAIAVDVPEYMMFDSESDGTLITSPPMPINREPSIGVAGVGAVAWVVGSQSFGWLNSDRRLAIYIGLGNGATPYQMTTPVATTGSRSVILPVGWALLALEP